MLFGVLFEHQATPNQVDEMHHIWSSVYKKMGQKRELGEMAVRFLCLLNNNYNNIQSEEDSALELYKTNKDTANHAVEISRQIEILIENLIELDKYVISDVLLRIQHPRFMAVCIIKSDYSSAEKEKLLKAWEKSTFKIFGLERRDSRFYKGDYISLGKKIYKHEYTCKKAIQNILDISQDNDELNSAVDELMKIDIYHAWAEEFKYLMYKREIYLAKGKSKIPTKMWKEIWLTSATDSIEHILPQSASNAVDDFKMEKRNKIFKHRLGNLLILDLKKNEALQNKPPKIKADYYNDLLIEKEVAEIIKQDDWNRKSVSKREEILKEWILEEWGNGNEK